MKIIVLAGGLSTERDVSLASAAGICNTLLEKGHDAFLLDVFLGLENAPENLEDVFTLPGHGLEIAKNISETEPDLAAVKASRPDQSDCFFGPNVIELCRLADMTFLGLHGGEGENGKLQASFDLLGIRYTGPDSLGCAVAMDKGLTKQIFMEAGVDTPSGVCLYKEDSDCSLESLGLSFPVVVKPCSGGSSIGVYIVNTEDEYRQALKNSFRYENEVVIETYIKGREFACGVIDGKALPPIEIIPKSGWFDYANKYQANATEEVCPGAVYGSQETRFNLSDTMLCLSSARLTYVLLRLKVYLANTTAAPEQELGERESEEWFDFKLWVENGCEMEQNDDEDDGYGNVYITRIPDEKLKFLAETKKTFALSISAGLFAGRTVR